MVKLSVRHAAKILFVLIVIILNGCNTERADIVKLEDGFINPPIENRPLAFWDWLNGYVDTSRMVYELEEMKDKGMQGAFIWDVGALIDPEQQIPAGPDLNISDLAAIKSIIDIASQRGAFKAAELESVGKIYNKLDKFLETVTKKEA